jgi:MFS transporter, OPA family, sugar phosphate sensor protein UhpC
LKNPFRFYATGKDKPLLKNQQKIDQLYKKNRISVLLSIALGAGFAYTCRLVISVVKKPLIDGGTFTAEELVFIGAAFFYSYAFGKFFNGILADYSNIKKVFASAVLISAVINLLMGWSPLLWIWIVLWGINGWFQGFNAPSGIVTLSNWFSNNERGRYYGIWATAHGFGEGLTFFGIAAIVNYFGWRFGFLSAGILCIFVAFVLYKFLQDRPQTLGLPPVADWRNDHGIIIAEDKEGENKTQKAQFAILKIPAVWIIGLASAMVYMTRYAINSWGILYLQEAKGYSLIEAGSIIGVNTIAGIFGCIAFGFISDKLFNAKRPPLNLIYAILEILALVVIFFSPVQSTTLLIIAFTVYGFTLSGLIASLGGLFAVDIAPKKAAGAAMGFIGIFSYVAAAIQEQISGILIERGTTIINDVRIYDFSTVKIYWIIASILSLIFAVFLWRTKPAD